MISIKATLRGTGIYKAEPPMLQPYVSQDIKVSKDTGFGTREIMEYELLVRTRLTIPQGAPLDYMRKEIHHNMYNYIYGDIDSRLSEIHFMIRNDPHMAITLLEQLKVYMHASTKG